MDLNSFKTKTKSNRPTYSKLPISAFLAVNI